MKTTIKTFAMLLLLPLCAVAQLQKTNTVYLTWDQPDATPETTWYVYSTSTIVTSTNLPPPPAPPQIVSYFTNWQVAAMFQATSVADMFHPKVALLALGTNAVLVVTASNVWGETVFSAPVTRPAQLRPGQLLRIGL